MLVIPEWIGYVVVVWSIFTFSTYVYFLVTIRNRQKTMAQDLWNQKVELQDLNGEVIKVPVVHIIKDKDGNEIEKVDMVVAPLWFTICYTLGEVAITKLKMSMLSAKGKIAREFNSAQMRGELAEMGLDAATAAVIGNLPKKLQGPALVLAKYLKPTGQNPQPGGSSTPRSGNSRPI